MFLKGACYIRVSTDEQAEYSPGAQLRLLRDYAGKNNITIMEEHVYMDEGISGRKADKRPAFMRMVAAAKSDPKPFDVILVHKFDRFARSREDSVVYKSLLRKEAGIKVISASETIEDDKFSVILEAMLEAMAEYYSLNLSEEVKKGMTEKAMQGGLQTGAPFGYRAENNRLLIVPEEAKAVQFLFSRFADGRSNISQLAKYLNDTGIKTKRGGSFNAYTVGYILRNPVYIGKLRWTPDRRKNTCNIGDLERPDTIIAQADHEAIINMKLWEKTQAMIRQTEGIQRKGQKETAAVKTWLNRLVRCEHCGHALVVTKSKYFQCNGYFKGKCAASQFVKIDTIEKLVLLRLEKDFTGNLIIPVLPKIVQIREEPEYEMLHQRLLKLRQKERRVKKAYSEGIDTLAEYRENKKSLENERQSVLDQLKKINRLYTDEARHEGADSSQTDETKQDKAVIHQAKNIAAFFTDPAVSLEAKYKASHFLIEQIKFSRSEKTLKIQYK